MTLTCNTRLLTVFHILLSGLEAGCCQTLLVFARTQPQTTVNMYILSGNDIRWNGKGQPFHASWINAGTAVNGSDVFLIGGNRAGQADAEKNRVAVYRASENRWEDLPSMKHNRNYKPTAYVLGDKLYAAGGNTLIRSIESLNISDPNAVWEEENLVLPFKFYDSASIVVGNRVYISGGFNEEFGSSLKNLYSWSVGESVWTREPNMILQRRGHCIVSDNDNTMYVIGGCAPFCNPLIEQYDIRNATWSGVPNPFDSDILHNLKDVKICAYWKDSIFLYGSGDDSVFYIYNTVARFWSKSTAIEMQGITFPMSAVIDTVL